MILTGQEIQNQHSRDCISIKPFNADQITTNSYDLCLGDTFIAYDATVIDPAKKTPHKVIRADNDGITMQPGDFLLGHSFEIIGSNHYVPIIHAKSGIARLGLFVHVTADLIDIGSHGQVTFQLLATLPVKLYPGMKIGQVSFWKPKGKIALYGGKYQGSVGPRVSEAYKDFEAAPFTLTNAA